MVEYSSFYPIIENKPYESYFEPYNQYNTLKLLSLITAKNFKVKVPIKNKDKYIYDDYQPYSKFFIQNETFIKYDPKWFYFTRNIISADKLFYDTFLKIINYYKSKILKLNAIYGNIKTGYEFLNKNNKIDSINCETIYDTRFYDIILEEFSIMCIYNDHFYNTNEFITKKIPKKSIYMIFEYSTCGLIKFALIYTPKTKASLTGNITQIIENNIITINPKIKLYEYNKITNYQLVIYEQNIKILIEEFMKHVKETIRILNVYNI